MRAHLEVFSGADFPLHFKTSHKTIELLVVQRLHLSLFEITETAQLMLPPKKLQVGNFAAFEHIYIPWELK